MNRKLRLSGRSSPAALPGGKWRPLVGMCSSVPVTLVRGWAGSSPAHRRCGLHSEYSSWQCQRCQSQDMTQAARSQSQLNPPYCGLCTWSERIFWIQSRLKKDKFIEARDTINTAGRLPEGQGEPTSSPWSCLFLWPRESRGPLMHLLTCWLVGQRGALR